MTMGYFDTDTLESWAKQFAPHCFTAWQISDESGYMGLWEWLDLNHPNAMERFKEWLEAEAQGDA